MVRYRIGIPDEKDISSKKVFIIDSIIPICLRNVNKGLYTILFLAEQECTEEKMYIQMMISADSNLDLAFLDRNRMNLRNIQNNQNRLEFYIESTKDLEPNEIYGTDFNMVYDEDKKIYYKAFAGKPSSDDKIDYVDLYITRDNFIKINLFFTKLMNYDSTAETVFINKKLKNIEFTTIDSLKLDGSATDPTSDVVHSHFTATSGKSIFKFNYISPKLQNRILTKALLPDSYHTLYGNSWVVSDIVYDNNSSNFILLYEIRSEITDAYKSTKGLVVSKELCDALDTIYK